MRVQKWLVRSLVFSLLLGMAGAALAYFFWTDPAAIRETVITSLEDQFPGADVSLEAARLRILGGILLTELRLFRRDDLTRTDFFYIPSGVVYHDKEQLLDGVLAFRKVELHRPRLRLIRERDGHWNMSGLTKLGGKETLLPTVVIHEGTILFEDRMVPSPLLPLEISGVKLTLINDPLSTVKIEGSGVSNPLGKIQLQGTWNRSSGQVHLTLQVQETRLSTSLMQRLIRHLPKESVKGLEVEGVADFQIELEVQLNHSQPVTHYDVQCHLHQGKCRHPKLPLPLDNLAMDLRCTDGQLKVEKLTATSGTSKITAAGNTCLECWEDQFETTIRIEKLPVCPELCTHLPEEVQQLHHMFKPSGPVTVHVELEKHNRKWIKQRCLLKPENVSLCYELFPYGVSGITGTIDADLLTTHLKIDLGCTTQAITLVGTWKGTGKEAEVDLHLQANQMPLDEKLIQALPLSLRDLARSFHANGWGDMQAHIYHAPGTENYSNEYHARFYDTTVKWSTFPYPLENVTGTLSIYPHHCEFKDFRGLHNGGFITLHGRTLPWNSTSALPHTSRLLLEITGQDIQLDTDLRKSLVGMPQLAKAWDTMTPAGKINFTSKVDQIPDRPLDLDIVVQLLACQIEPAFFRYPLAEMGGFLHFRQNRLELKNLKAWHQNTHLAIDKGTVDFSEKGGFYVDLEEIRGNPIYPDDGLVKALPISLQNVFNSLNLKDPLAVQTQLIISQPEEAGSKPDIYWKGRGWLTNATLNLGVEVSNVTGVVGSVGRYDGQQLQGFNSNVVLSRASILQQALSDVRGHLQIKKETPDVLLVNMKSTLFGGDLSGEARVDLNSTLRYEMNLTASQIDLKQFGNQNLKDRTNLKGRASARLHLTGQGTDITTLNGNGMIDILSAKLYNLPFLLDLLKFLGLRWPDRTAFEEAHANFSIQGTRLTISKVDLWGNAISLTGQGNVNLDGTDVKLDFYPSWARMEQILPPAFKSVSPAVSKNLLKIEVRGKISDQPKDLIFHKRPVPLIVDPIMQIQERITGQATSIQKKSLK